MAWPGLDWGGVVLHFPRVAHQAFRLGPDSIGSSNALNGDDRASWQKICVYRHLRVVVAVLIVVLWLRLRLLN